MSNPKLIIRAKTNNQIKWVYDGKTKNGDSVSGIIEAPTAIIARVKLRKNDIVPFSIKPQRIFSGVFNKKNKPEQKPISIKDIAIKRAKLVNFRDEIHNLVKSDLANQGTKKKINNPVKDKEITIIIKQFTVIMKSGVPLLRAFDIIIDGQENKKLRAILADIRFGVENGLTLSESFGAYPRIFDGLFINFLKIGEQGGILDNLLDRYVEYKEKIEVIYRKVKSALAYPVIVVIVSVLVLSIVLGFVVPQFQKIFAGMNVQLPGPTLIVIAVSNAVLNYWWLIITIGVAAVLLLRYAYFKSAQIRFYIDSYIFRVPLFGGLAKMALIARWTRTLSLLFAAGVPLNDALRSIALLANNYLYGAATLNIKKDVESGSSLYHAMLKTTVFPNMANQMVAVGEESGSLDILLESVANYYDQEVETIIETLLSMIEPATIVILGIILGSIIVAIYLPLFHLGDVVG